MAENEKTTILTLTKHQRDGQAVEQYTYDPTVIDQAVMLGDMKQMDPPTRLAFYRAVCLSVGLNPLTQPFTALERQDKTVWLYANSSCTQQLAALHKVSFRDMTRAQEQILGEPFYVVTVTAYTPDGRAVPSQSVVSLAKKKKTQKGTWPNGDPKWIDVLDTDGEPIMVPLRGEALANAIMKADTKALRRATLALVGLGWVYSDFEGQRMALNMQTGEITDPHARPIKRVLDQASTHSKEELIAELYGDDPRGSTPQTTIPVFDKQEKGSPWDEDHPDMLHDVDDPDDSTRQGQPCTWRDTLEAHKNNPALHEGLRDKMKLALKPASETSDAKGLALASAVLDWLNAQEKA